MQLSLTYLLHLQVLLSNMVYADDDESIVDAEVNFSGSICVLGVSDWFLL